MEGIRVISVSFLFFLPMYHCFHPSPMPCNVSLTDSCSAFLYYVPKQSRSLDETAALFGVASGAVRRTADGFLIGVACTCPADHDGYTWHAAYTVQPGDTWNLISVKFGLLVLGKPETTLLAPMNIRLDILCGCFEGAEVVTYVIEPGDTLFTIGSHFKANFNDIKKLNRIGDTSVIYPGDKIFVPTKGLDHLVMVDEKDLNAKKLSRSQHHLHTVLGAVLASIAVLLVSSTIFFCICCCKYKRQEHLEAYLRGQKVSHFCPPSRTNNFASCASCKGSIASFESVMATVFPYAEVCDTTSNFSASQKIGQGSYGCVYYGKLRGADVAIKRMKNTKSKEFFVELNILCKVHHNNLIKLIGYSMGEESLFLVYEFAQNGALSDHLHNYAAKGHKPLQWRLRLQIALDAAKGLEYIHVHVTPYYVHRDVKTSNILLDSKFRAKVADFGLAKLIEHSPDVPAAASRIVGTFGYLAPEYIRDGCVTQKSDVYAVGVVLMELITGQPALSRYRSAIEPQHLEHRSLVDLMLSYLENSHDSLAKLVEIVDPHLIDHDMKSLLQMALLSRDCVDGDWKRRPDMSQVVLRLTQIAGTVPHDETSSVHPIH